MTQILQGGRAFGRLAGPVAAVLTTVLFATGCVSNLNRTYYVKTYDPRTDTANYFRLVLEGDSKLSKTKFSVGFFDRSAVEVLFGEASIQQEFKRQQVLDEETCAKLEQAGEELKETSGDVEVQTAALRRLAHRLQGIATRFRTRLDLQKDLLQQFEAALEMADKALQTAYAALDRVPAKPDTARRHLVEARATLEALRVAVDGEVLVRFFDGAGNEIDLTTQALVIFVASDVSQFSAALRQLAESEVARSNLLLTVLGPRIREAELLEHKVAAADAQRDRMIDRLGDLLAGVGNLPGAHQGDEEAKKKGLESDLAKLKKSLLAAATAAAGRATPLHSAAEIRGFAQALEDQP